MINKRKSYFQEKVPVEIKSLKVSEATHSRGLVEKIDGLGKEDALIVKARIIPGKFYKGVENGAEASRKCYKHGSLIALTQPETLAETYDACEIPLDLRVNTFSEIQDMKEQEINYVGYSWRPVFGRNKLKRVVPFVWLAEGARIFSYAENFSSYVQGKQAKTGIKVEAYPDAKRVRKEGANVVVEVASRTQKKSKYKFGLMHVPFIPNNPEKEINYNLATVLSFQPALVKEETEEDSEFAVGRTPHQIYDIQYKFAQSREGSPVVRFSPQDIAGYLGIIKNQLIENHNMTPLMFNPFALPSRHQAEFYMKLCNNILMFDPTLESKDKLRKPHLAEKSILLGRAIGKFGHDDFAYWDPTRDGIFKDYKWKV